MRFLYNIWIKASNCKALEHSSGKLETLFFESVYRITYLAGFAILDNSIMYDIYSGIVKIIVGLLLFCETWHLISESTSLDDIVDNATVTLMNFTTLYRYINMRENRSTYKKLASAMESPYFYVASKNRKKLISFWAQRNENFIKLLISLGFCTLAAWYIYPLMDEIEYNLMISARFPFNYKTPERYPIFYFTVLVGFSYGAIFVMVNDLIMQAHLMHLLCQYTVLADCFEEIIPDCIRENKFLSNSLIGTPLFKDTYLTRLNNLVEQHKFILNNTMELKRSISTPMLWQLVASTMLICFVGYQASASAGPSNVKFFMSLLYLMYNLFELFIFCKWSDEIKIQSENISSSIYCSGWEQGLAAMPGIRSRLLLVAIRASKPVVMTAGSLFDLSLASYTTLVKTSYSAITVLRRFQH